MVTHIVKKKDIMFALALLIMDSIFLVPFLKIISSSFR